ncbi:MAG: nitrilase-related carbon-nitrogen hydrolase, partial [Bacilli bacterium]
MPLHVALIQIDIAFGDPDKNFAKVTTKIHEAMAGKPDIIVLPELWSTGYDLSRLDEIADDEGESTKTLISSLAKQYNVNIISGSVAKRSASGITNTMYSFNRNGDVIGEYSKVHLFRLMDEEKYLQSAQQEGMLEIEGTPCAGLICYDIRFPEWIRKHVIAGANILFVSAEWPKPRLSHWRTLLIARA